MKKLRLRDLRIGAFVMRVGAFMLRSRLLAVWLGLCALGVGVGMQARPQPGTVPYEELFENLRVLSYRESPSDPAAHFVVELTAHGKAFRQYDVDARRFLAPAHSHDYWRSISGTRYPSLKVRGHVSRGFWLELPDASTNTLLPDQFNELYSTSLDFVKPVGVATTVLGLLSGYSVGYRLATWGTSLSNPRVQDRIVAVPGIGRLIAREAWRRVALEPAMVFADNDAARFASVSGRQRLYTNFFKLAVHDSNQFIPLEIARLELAGAARESRAMSRFVHAVDCAGKDSCDLSSVDFGAIEEWATLLDRRGHWASDALPPLGEERLRYFGTLAWYGLAPEAFNERRIWVGPRLLVRNGDAEGFVADEIPLVQVACPIAWHGWLRGDDTSLSANAWTAQWMGDARQFAPVVKFCMGVARAAQGSRVAVLGGNGPGDVETAATGDSPLSTPAPAREGESRGGEPLDPRHTAGSDSLAMDGARVDSAAGGHPDSAALAGTQPADSLAIDPDRPAFNAGIFHSPIGDFGK